MVEQRLVFGGKGVERPAELVQRHEQRRRQFARARHVSTSAPSASRSSAADDVQQMPRSRRCRLATSATKRSSNTRRRSPAMRSYSALARRHRSGRCSGHTVIRTALRSSHRITAVRLRTLKVGCFGGGTGLPSLLGGLKRVPWIDLHAIVTMFDSGGSSGQLRDELGVLPPGDVLKCALTLARNEREARKILLARLPMFEHGKLAGHTGGNLLLSMMEQYTGDFLAAVDGLRALLGCRGHVWPITVRALEHHLRDYTDGKRAAGKWQWTRGQAAGRTVERLWLEPPVSIHPRVAETIRSLDAVIIGPGSFFTSLLPIFLVRRLPRGARAR